MEQAESNAFAILVGASPDASPEQLRAAYDQAMQKATRAGDHSRALQLSRAFDALPARTRTSVYPGSRVGGSIPSYSAARSATGALPKRSRGRFTRGRSGMRPRRTASAGRRRFHRVSWKGLIGYGVVIPAIIGIAAYVIYRQNNPYDAEYRSPPQFEQTVQPAQDGGGPVQPDPAEGQDGPTLQLPADAPAGADGLVSVVCQPSAGSAAYVLTAPPGATVVCTNGAVPRIVQP